VNKHLTRLSALPVTFLLVAACLLSSCGPTKFQAGAAFDPKLVETALHPGLSTKVDVQQILGAPYGSGSAMMPYHDRPRETWIYFLDRGSVDLSSGHAEERFSYLFVFFQGDRFDSYIWFDTM
jgi:hypothetical protein